MFYIMLVHQIHYYIRQLYYILLATMRLFYDLESLFHEPTTHKSILHEPPHREPKVSLQFSIGEFPSHISIALMEMTVPLV